MGGNAILRRAVLLKVGLYKTWLGRTDKGLLSGEDEELYGRLLASDAKGMYLPNLKIYHHVVPERLTKKYFRSWCFWRGVSLGLLERTRKQDCAYLLGVPRWHYRSAARGLIRPWPYSSSRPVVPRSVAVCFMIASTAAGLVIPCCINSAAKPETWGADIEVPVE